MSKRSFVLAFLGGVLGLGLGSLLPPRLFAVDFIASPRVAAVSTFAEASPGEALDRDLLTWMKTVQNANAEKWKTFYQKLLPAESPVTVLPVYPRVKGTLSGFFNRAKSLFSPKVVAPVTVKPGMISLDAAFTNVLKLQVERDNGRLLASLPADGVVDVTHMAPQVTAAAQVLNARWMMRSIPFGVYMDGSFYDGIFNIPLTRTFKDTPDTGGLDDLNKIFMQMPCSDLGRLGKNLYEEIGHLGRDLAGKQIIFRSLYNGLLRSLVVLSDDLAQCQIQPPDFWGYPTADGTSTLLESLKTTPGFSLNSIWLTDPKTLRLRNFKSTDLAGRDVTGFLNGAFLHLTPGLASCSSMEKIFGGSADFSCPSCKGGGSPAGDATTSLLEGVDGHKDSATAPSSWGECRNSSTPGGGAGLGNFGSCYGSGANFAGLTGEQLSCTRNGFRMNVDGSAFPGSGPFCRTSLVGGDVVGRAVPHDDERIRGLDRDRHRPDLAGDLSQRLGDEGISATEGDVASLIDAIIGQFQSGERTVSQADLPGDRTVRVNSDGDVVIDSDMSIRDGCYVAAAAIANNIISTSATNVAGDTLSYGGTTMNRLYHYNEGDEDKDKTATAPDTGGGTKKLCEAGEGGCGSGTCGMVPAVMQKFTNCLFGHDPTLSTPDPCRFGMCLDESDAGSFASQCAPSVAINDGCSLVDCASEGALGALASTEMSRCCSGGAASSSSSQGPVLTRQRMRSPGGSSEIPGWNPDGMGELPSGGGVDGGLGPQNPPDGSQ